MAELQQPNIVGNFLAAYSSGLERQQQQQDAAYQRQRQAKADDRLDQQFQWQMDDRQIAAANDRANKIARVALISDTPEKWAMNVPVLMQQLGIDGPAPDFSTREAKIAEAQSLQEMLKAQMDEREAARLDRVANANIAQSYAAARASNRQGQGGGEGFDGKPPSGYVWGKAADGSVSLVPIKGGPADPALRPLTHDQGLAAGFAERLITADQYFANEKVSDALRSSKQKGMSGVPLIGNYLTSTEFQQGDQASREFINAQLRRESGAVIGPTEFENAFQQYLPQPGDSPEVLAQKAKSRKIAIYNMLKVAGPQFSERARQYMPQAPTSETAVSGPKEGERSKSKTGRPIIFRNGKWEYQ